MKVTSMTTMALQARREERRMIAAGYERVGETGGKLWELHRGARWQAVITDVMVAADGKSLWVKIGKPG